MFDQTAYDDGYRAGGLDALTGYRNGYAWFVESTPGYPQTYSIGYRAGWVRQTRRI